MNLLYICAFMFLKDGNKTFGLPSCADSFFEKYLSTFDSIRVLGENIKSYLNNNSLIEIKNPKIEVEILPSNTKPKDFKNDKYLKKILTDEIKKADAILIKPASRRGMMAIRIAKKYKKPYMIEMTGDLHNALVQSPSIIKRLYAPIIYHQIRKNIKDCEYGLYVSKDYLQKKYPIKGKMCGCSDVVLEITNDDVLEKRLCKIDKMSNDKVINLALIGFYQGILKGVDTAIRALARLPKNYHLSILGNGTEENRQKWYKYAENIGVCSDRIHFPTPLKSVKEVLEWLDNFDFFVFPTRSEGFGRVVAEAMSRGLPIFATNICTMPELLPSNCLFELGDDDQLAKLILHYTENKEETKELSRINFNHVKDYNFELLCERRKQFLDEFKEYCDKNKKE